MVVFLLVNRQHRVVPAVGPSPYPVAFFTSYVFWPASLHSPPTQDTEVLPNLKHVVRVDDDLLVFS